jgi:hypothetical protein
MPTAVINSHRGQSREEDIRRPWFSWEAIMLEPWLLWAWRIIAVLGLGVVLFWMGKTIKAMKGTVDALKGTVDAQKHTIEAQSAKMDSMERVIKMMETVFKSTNEETMLARLEAHKKFVDHEKDAIEKRLTVQLEEAKRTREQGTQSIIQQAKIAHALAQLATNALPYVPTNRREEFIRTLDIDHLPVLRHILDDVAQSAPDLSAESRQKMIAEIR